MSGLYSNRDLRMVGCCGSMDHHTHLQENNITNRSAAVRETTKDKHWSYSVSRSSNTSEYWETERDLSTLSHNSVANSKPYMRSFTRNQLDQ